MKNRDLFLMILEGRKSWIKVPTGLVPGEGCSLFPRWYFAAASSRGKELSVFSHGRMDGMTRECSLQS
jgi:hypothetical protein